MNSFHHNRSIALLFAFALLSSALVAGNSTTPSAQSSGGTIDTIFTSDIKGSTFVITPSNTVSSTQIAAASSNTATQQARVYEVSRVISSTGEELEGAMAYYYPSGQTARVGANGFVSLHSPGDNQLFIIHPGYALFESSGKMTGGNLVVRSKSDQRDAERFAALPELNRILEMCRPVVGNSRTENVLVPKKEDQQKSTETSQSEDIQAPKSSTLQSLSPKIEGDVVLSLDVMPNPSQDKATIRFRLHRESRVMVELYRLESGERVFIDDFGSQSAGVNSIQLNLSSLSAGSYAVILRSSSCEYALSTFVKN